MGGQVFTTSCCQSTTIYLSFYFIIIYVKFRRCLFAVTYLPIRKVLCWYDNLLCQEDDKNFLTNYLSIILWAFVWFRYFSIDRYRVVVSINRSKNAAHRYEKPL